MASQPNNCSLDFTTISDSFFDFGPILLFPNGFYHQHNDLTLSQGNGPLNTPEFEINNPFVPSTPGLDKDPSNEPSVACETTDEEIVALLSEIEANGKCMGNNSGQQMDASGQKTIAQIENELRNSMVQITDTMDVEAVKTAIKRHPGATMRMRTQPVRRQRFRYREKVKRYLKQSKTNPMSINLPILDGCLTKPSQSFGIRSTLVTTRNNPQQKTFLHQNEMLYNGENAQQNGLGSFLIPLTDKDIRQRIKKFSRLSVIKTLQDDYTFELTPFDPLITDDHAEYYTLPNENNLTKVQKSKCFDEAYNTDDLQIVSQLMIKQHDNWHPTDLYCETHVITNTN